MAGKIPGQKISGRENSRPEKHLAGKFLGQENSGREKYGE